MKTILLVAALCFVGALALTDEQKAKLTEYRESCIAETGVDKNVVDQAKAGTFPEKDDKLACFASCMLKKLSVMKPDGSIDEEIARQKITAIVPPEHVEDILSQCIRITGDDVCDTALKVVKCLKQAKS